MQRLPALLPAATAARWRAALDARPGGSLRLFDALDADEVLQALVPVLRPRLDDRLLLIATQCWVRRATPPHSWHQDGALHHDFISRPRGSAPLAMTTCWITLSACGGDAPGLAWVDAPLAELLPPVELTDRAVRARFPAATFEHAVLEPGDALLFDGALLHRTHVTPAMTRPRTSIELRFVAAGAVPPALAGETLSPIG